MKKQMTIILKDQMDVKPLFIAIKTNLCKNIAFKHDMRYNKPVKNSPSTDINLYFSGKCRNANIYLKV